MTKDNGQRTKNKLIVALDVATAREAREIVAELTGEVASFKIGLQLFTAAGASFVRELTESGAPVFLDLKFHDIPNTVAAAAVEAARLGVWMFNVHAAGGREMMERTARDARETAVREGLAQPKIIAVTVLTSSNAETLREIGVADEPLAQVVKLARLAAVAGLDGVVASPHEAAAIKTENGKWKTESEAVKENFIIVTPGIRPLSALRLPFSTMRDDQKRVMTPGAAIRAGADYLVVGRPILQSDDRVEAARRILAEIESAEI